MLFSALLSALDRHARERPNAVALVETGGRLMTYGDLAVEVQALAASLAGPPNPPHENALNPGDRVLFAVRPRLEAFALALAIWRAGGVVVPLEARLSDEVFAARMIHLAPSWLAAESTLYTLARQRLIRCLLRSIGLPLPDLATLALRAAHPILVGPLLPGQRRALSYRAFRRADRPAPRPLTEADAPLLAVFTSGTTAEPRTVLHTNASLGASLRLVADHLALGPHDVIYGDQLHLVLPALLAGARVVLPRGRRSPGKMLAEMHRFGVTHLQGAPRQLEPLLELVERRGQRLPPILRSVTLGAAPVPASFLPRLQRALPPGASAGCVYALTEMLPVAWVSVQEKLAYRGPGDLAGRPFPGVEGRLADDGELLLRGPNLCARYWGEPRLETLASGDLATLDAAGRIVLLGRKKDMIIRDGINIYPSLVEPTVERVPGVRACALVGLPDAGTADERVVLAVEPERNVDATRLLRRLQTVLDGLDAPYRPRQVLLVRLPRSGRSGKVDRAAVRLLARRRLRC